MQRGVCLTGWDVPERVEDKVLRVIVAVECANCALAPSLVALVVRDVQPSGEVRVATVRKYLPSDGTGVAVGLEAPLREAGRHDLHIMVCAVGESGELEDVLFETSRVVTKTEAARSPLPRLQHSEEDSLVLCGVDIPTTVEVGRLRAIVALKRIWHDAPTVLALIVRDLMPDGSRRAAVVRKTFGEEADTIGLEVPMAEAGEHRLTLQVAKIVDGEFVEVHFVPWHRGSGCLGADAPVTGAAADEYNLNVVDCNLNASVTVARRSSISVSGGLGVL